LVHLADVAISDKDYPLAEKRLLAALQLQADNAIVLNNLAWVGVQLKRDDALRHAERANSIAPNQPQFMDTWASALSASGDHAKAIELQRKALALRPDNAGLRLNLAKIYVAAGDKSKAKSELAGLAKLGDTFPAQAEVSAMLKTL
jgi:Flp pilus assembly protein TadD